MLSSTTSQDLTAATVPPVFGFTANAANVGADAATDITRLRLE